MNIGLMFDIAMRLTDYWVYVSVIGVIYETDFAFLYAALPIVSSVMLATCAEKIIILLLFALLLSCLRQDLVACANMRP